MTTEGFERTTWCACHTYNLVGEHDVREIAGYVHTPITCLRSEDA